MTVRPGHTLIKMSTLSFAVAAIIAQAAAFAASTTAFNLPAQPLAQSLRAVGSATNTNILFDPPLIRDLQAPELKAEVTIDEAIVRLLAGTGIGHEFVSDNTIVVGADEVRLIRLAQADAAPSNVSTEGAESAELEEVVVTAQKRMERLQDVPIAISVLSGEDLDRSSGTGVRDALNLVPGVISTTLNQNRGSVISIRGIAPQIGGSSIAYYVDSVPFGFVRSNFLPDTNVYDLERIEVLRGPQGTLYGANAQNGVGR